MGEGGYAVESVNRALQLLSLLLAGEVLSVKVAAEHLDVAPSTAHRLLQTLCHQSFAAQDRSREYRLGPAMLGVTSGGFGASALRRAARPVMAELQAEIGETMHLMVLQGNRVQFIDGIECEKPLRVAIRIGALMPAYCSGGGKALLAALPNQQLLALHKRGLPPWPNRKITSLDGLKRELAEVRRQGYGLNCEETEVGVCGVGVTVGFGTEAPLCAITFVAPAVRFGDRPLSSYVTALQGCAASIAASLAASHR